MYETIVIPDVEKAVQRVFIVGTQRTRCARSIGRRVRSQKKAFIQDKGRLTLLPRVWQVTRNLQAGPSSYQLLTRHNGAKTPHTHLNLALMFDQGFLHAQTLDSFATHLQPAICIQFLQLPAHHLFGP